MKNDLGVKVNLNKIRWLCNSQDVPNRYNAQYNEDGRYWFINNGADVLAVCHWDTVSKSNNPDSKFLKDRNGKNIGLESIQLDDRLGAYILLELLPSMGLKFDVLISTDEEIGRSTAQFFKPEHYHNREYNWIFSFDRRDVFPVLYDYEADKDWVDAVESIVKIGYGSFSDISHLKHLGVCGVNWGTGYYNEHTKNCYTLIDSIKVVVSDFERFYNLNYNKKFTFDSSQEKYYDWKKYDYGYGYEYDYNEFDIYEKWDNDKTKKGKCGFCNNNTQIIDNEFLGNICEDCYNELLDENFDEAINQEKLGNDIICKLCGQKIAFEDCEIDKETGKEYCYECYPFRNQIWMQRISHNKIARTS